MWRYILYYLTACIVYTDASVDKKFYEEYYSPYFVEPAPNTSVMVAYSGLRVKLGTITHRLDVATKPKLKYSGKMDHFYTACMASPDVQNEVERENYREWDHWLTVNIPGSKVESGEEIFPYVIPLDARKSDGTIPYIFVVYEQPGKLDIKPEHFNATIRKMGLFRVKDLAKKYNLTGPLYGNYFLLRNA